VYHATISLRLSLKLPGNVCRWADSSLAALRRYGGKADIAEIIATNGSKWAGSSLSALGARMRFPDPRSSGAIAQIA
jgi:hypothetical protein